MIKNLKDGNSEKIPWAVWVYYVIFIIAFILFYVVQRKISKADSKKTEDEDSDFEKQALKKD